MAVNVETGVKNSIGTNAEGFYSLPALPVGHYKIQIQAKGFSNFEETGLVLDVNSAFYGPDGGINDTTFGVIGGAGSARIGQVAIKFMF